MANARKRPGRPRKSPAAIRLTERDFAEKCGTCRICFVCAKKKKKKKMLFLLLAICNVVDEFFQLFIPRT